MSDYEGVLPSHYLSWLEIDTSAIRHNYELLRALLKPGTAAFGVVKADAYGHGAVRVARELESAGAEMLCVARVEEAIELRAAEIQSPLLVFAPPFFDQAVAAINANASMVVCHPDHIAAAAEAAKQLSRRARVHLKIDVGMGRIGAPPQEALLLSKMISSMAWLELEGVMTHFPSADMKPGTTTVQQIQAFQDVHDAVIGAGILVKYFHTSNSAATMDYPASHFGAVRLGIAMYGQYPSSQVERQMALRPAMSLKSRIAYLKDVPAGQGLSYGHTYVTSHASRIASVPLGYADGYPRHASNQTYMLVRGRRAPQVGRVCMDMLMLDVTDIADVAMGDIVLGFGKHDEYSLPIESVAESFGTIGYELSTRIGKRLPRLYL